MGSVIYRDRERERFDDSRTTISRRGDDRGGYTTVKRYVVKAEDDSRSYFGGGSRVRPERIEETRIVRREVDVEDPPRRYERREDPRSSERELVIRRDRTEDEPRRDYGRREDRTDDRELVIRRTTERKEPSQDRETTVSRYDDRRDDRYELDIRRGDYGDRDLRRYNRTTEYFQPAPPQTIVIRNQIVMPRGRDDDNESSRRSEAAEERSVVKREPSRGRDEEFFYEKKVRERIDEPSRRDDDYDRRLTRREISPHDSVSQVGRRDRGYSSSDDSIVYVRNKVTEDEGYEGSRSPRHRRHIAEGAIAGLGVAELLRHHNKQEGRETPGGLGRVGRDVGAGALGALAAEGVTRARSAYRERSKSRRRSRSDSGGRGGRGRARSGSRSRAGSRDRDRSRSESTSRAKKLAGLGLGAAAIAAAAIYAQKRNNKEKSQSPDGRGRSSSRRRASSVPPSEADDARNPSHRNKRMAEAGAAGAVLAALVERQRSKSRGGRNRSQSRVRQALPVIAAGLGSAGIAALYEKNKANKQTEEAEKSERRAPRSRSRSHSRGRGRSADPYYDGPRGATASDPNLIEYGEGNVYGNNYGADYYGQPPPGDSYYNNHQNAVVPAVAGAGAYGASREVRPSRSRSPSSQGSTDDGRRRRRHRRQRGSRSRSAGQEAAAAVGGVAATSEYERQKQEKRDRKARRRQEQQGGYAQDLYEDPYNPHQQQFTPTPPSANDPYATQTGFYPQNQQFPPPPGAAPPQFQPQQPMAPYAPGTSYNPNEFPPPPGAAPAQYNGNFASGGNADPYAPRGRGADENVSVAPTFGGPSQHQTRSVPDGLVIQGSVPSPAPPPLINVQRPLKSSATNPQRANPFLPVPDPFSNSIPSQQPRPLPSRTRSISQPPAHRKSVAFADAPDIARNVSTTTIDSSPQSDHHRHGNAAKGYEAGDDTDSTIDAQRTNRRATRSQTPATTAKATSAAAVSGPLQDVQNTKKRHHNRRRSAEPTTTSSSAAGKSTLVGSTASTARPPPPPAASPAPSDETIDLPERFDKYGRKKLEPGEDPPADRLDNILAGNGVTGLLFGNFVDGLLGPDGRRRKGI